MRNWLVFITGQNLVQLNPRKIKKENVSKGEFIRLLEQLCCLSSLFLCLKYVTVGLR